MKKQFQREAHARQDKAHKSDYAENMKAGTPSTGAASGIGPEKLKKLLDRKAMREDAKRKASQLFFVYGKWLWHNTNKLSYFANLNAHHATADSTETEAAFKACKQKWESDKLKIWKAIEAASVAKRSGVLGFLHGPEFLNWKLPKDLEADVVSRKLPAAFQPPKPAKQAAG